MMLFFNKNSSSRFIALSIFLILVSVVVYSVVAQSSTSFGAVELIAINAFNYEEYSILDMDSDQFLTEEDLALQLDSINEQITNASRNITYLQTTY